MAEKIQRLSEGMDFIEESTSFSDESLSFQEINDTVISESNGVKSPYKILGKACGCFAPINEFSRNRRLYSSDLWPTVLENEAFKSRLAHREVFGCLGHADKLVDDLDIQEGKVSHIVTCLEVRESADGKPFLYGELEILDTPAGRILEAMYKGGANLYVSSRAAGKLYPVPGQNYSLVKPDQYHVHCFDVVCRPGFLQARPTFEAAEDDAPKPTIQEAITENAETTVYVAENSEIKTLQTQIDKLAKIVEKVVDDVYEEPVEEAKEEPEQKELEKKPEEAPQMQEQPIAQPKEKANEALLDFVSLMASTNISEEKFEEIIDIISNSKKEDK